MSRDEIREFHIHRAVQQAVGGVFAPSLPTIRDQFAMAALTGLLASEEFHSLTTAAKMSYAFADAMMAERNKTAPPVEVKG